MKRVKGMGFRENEESIECREYRDKMWRVIIDMRIRMGGSMG